MPNDLVHVNDAGRISVSKREAYFWGAERSVVEVKGWVSCLLRERGKIVPGSRREGHNIWTNTGREFLAMLMTYQPNGSTAYRSDRIAYMGVGIGLQTEDASVVGLREPVSYAGSSFLAPVSHSLTDFPLRPTRTTVRYSRIFAEDEITYGGVTSRLISELGLFTDGHQNSFAQGGRQVEQTSALLQSPAAYKAILEPIEKTTGLEFEIDWEIRF